MPDNELDLKNDTAIDKYKLDEEWAQLPEKIQRWEERLLDEEHKRDRLKDKIELKYAEKDLEIRLSPKKFQLEESPTERMIRSTILQDEEYREIQEQYIESKYQVVILKIAVRKMKVKEKTLEKLTKLFLNNYYLQGYEAPEEDPSARARNALNATMRTRKFLREKNGN